MVRYRIRSTRLEYAEMGQSTAENMRAFPAISCFYDCLI